ncbi:MAG TPA: FecR family protein [Candidatus Sulfotelmatobacter sp.]|nr:FecR family protein [Candidatus Sulfotelmatobacter sp.]
MSARRIIWAAGLLLAVGVSATGRDGAMGGPAANIAGHITGLVPEARVVRAEETLVAAKDMGIVLHDEVKTESGGRVRIELADGSVLNVGSNAQLRILQHDPARQRTVLELIYGRLLVTATKISRRGGQFDVRSPIAVAGVVGTKLGLRVEQEYADVVCKEGTVRVRNTDPSVAGEVMLQSGEFTHVERGKPPTPPAPASPERIQAGEDATSIPEAK